MEVVDTHTGELLNLMDTEARRLRSSSEVKTTAEMPDDTASNSTAKKPKKEVKVKFPCGNCSKTTSGCAALICNVCEHWHHIECIPGMKDASFQTLEGDNGLCVFLML